MVALLQRINPGFLSKNTFIVVFCFAAANFAFYFFNRRYAFSFPYLAIAGYTTFAMTFGLLVNEAVTNGNIPGNNTLTSFISSLLSTTIALGISLLSFHYFEQPFLKLKQRFS